MSTMKHSSGLVQRTQPSAVQLTEEERKLVERFDQRASHRPAKRSRLSQRLQSTAFFLPWLGVVV